MCRGGACGGNFYTGGAITTEDLENLLDPLQKVLRPIQDQAQLADEITEAFNAVYENLDAEKEEDDDTEPLLTDDENDVDQEKEDVPLMEEHYAVLEKLVRRAMRRYNTNDPYEAIEIASEELQGQGLSFVELVKNMMWNEGKLYSDEKLAEAVSAYKRNLAVPKISNTEELRVPRRDEDGSVLIESDDEDATVGTTYAAKKAQETIEEAVAARQQQLDNQPTENERLERRAERKMLEKMENMVKADRARVTMDNTDPNIYCEVDDLRRQRGFKSRTDCWADAVKDLEDVMDIVPDDIANAVFLKRLNLTEEEYNDLLRYNREQSTMREAEPARPKRERISKVVSDNSAMPKTSKPTKLTWIDHVKLYAKKHKITYGEALSLAGPSWRGCKQNRTCPPKYKRCVKTKCAVKSDSQRWGEEYVLATPPKPKKKTTTRAPAKKPSGSKTSAPKKTRTPAKKPSGSKTSARKKAPAKRKTTTKRKTARGRGMVQ